MRFWIAIGGLSDVSGLSTHFRRVEHVPYGVYLNGAIRAENQIIFDQRGVTKNPVDRRI